MSESRVRKLRGVYFHPPTDELPGLVGRERAVLACGCYVVVGLRLDNHETATGADPCSERHAPLMRDFNVRLFDSLAARQPRPLIDVVAELLEEAAKEHV